MSEQMERDLRIEAEERAERLTEKIYRLENAILIVEYTRQKEALENIRAILDNPDIRPAVKLEGIDKIINQLTTHQIKLEVDE